MDTDFLNKSDKRYGLKELLFEQDELNRLKKKLQNLEVKNVVFCSFESQFARSGGLAAVIKKLLPAVADHDEVEHVFLFTPFYPFIIDSKKVSSTGILFDVDFDGNVVNVELFRYASPGSKVKEYYFHAPGFFESRNPINDPYGYFPDDPERNNKTQLENALFFCKAVPLALKSLKLSKNTLINLKEWQTALVALTVKDALLDGKLESCACVQTMHNPFDSWLSSEDLMKISLNKKLQNNKIYTNHGGITAYQAGIQLLDAPVTTVSEHFARELTTDLLQNAHFAEHLQDIFKEIGVLGINNGLFIDYPSEYSENRDYEIEEIKKVKSSRRKALLEILAKYNPKESFGRLTYKGESIISLPDEIPILVMSGRLDAFQKGFDILLLALERFASDEIKVVLSPLPVTDSDLDVFRSTVEKCEGNIVVFPIRMEEGYHELQMGSTFGIMPSIYEPFGSAIEYMVSGTVTIARSTGGLVNQIEDGVSGFLYRESPETYTLENIRVFADTVNAMQKRRNNPWVQGMALELYKTIKHAASMYRESPEDYYRLIIEGLKKARSFTWKKAADAYYKLYQKTRMQ